MVIKFDKKAFLAIIAALFMSATVLIIPTVKVGANENKVIVIDAGHGGIDGGATGVNTKTPESVLNLDVSMRLKKLFLDNGYTVFLTRETDDGLYGDETDGFKKRDLKARVEFAKKHCADIFISVHMNKYLKKTRRGAQVFYKAGSEKSETLAACVQEKLNAMKRAARSCSPLKGDYYLLNMLDCAAIIAECGFLSSPEDEKLLLDETYRQELADAVFDGVKAYADKNVSKRL